MTKFYEPQNDAEAREVFNPGTRTAVVIFGSQWCAPCKVLKKDLQELLERPDMPPNVYGAYVDAEKSPDVVGEYVITSFPTIIVADGRVGSRKAGGMMTRDQLKMMILAESDEIPF